MLIMHSTFEKKLMHLYGLFRPSRSRLTGPLALSRGITEHFLVEGDELKIKTKPNRLKCGYLPLDLALHLETALQFVRVFLAHDVYHSKVGTNMICSAAQRLPPQQSPPYTQPYASSLPRTQGASDYFPQRAASAYATPTETGSTIRRSPLADPSPYQPPASYQGPQETPIMPQGDEYMHTGPGQPLYGPNSVYAREYMESLGQSDNIDPNMLQHVTSASHRTAWEGGRQDYPTWPVVRTGEHRQQVLYSNQEFKEDNYHYQSVS